MDKLVVLELDGELKQQGFRAKLEIGEEQSRPNLEITGYLPPSSELRKCLENHSKNYHNVGAPSRIKAKRIIYDGDINHHISECQESAIQLRHHLSAWLEAEDFRPLDKRLREVLNPDDTIRFVIRTDNQEIQKLPWHLWDFFQHYHLAEIAFSSPQSEDVKQLKATSSSEKLRILAILGHSANIDIQSDRQVLESLPNVEIVFLVEPQHQDINDQLWEQSWDIIFFAGHSETEEDKGRIYLNETESLTIDELWFALRKAVNNGLKLAIFNSCDGLGLAQRLNDLHIPQVVVMRELVPDEVAQAFLTYFLQAFAKGTSLYLALREARERLQGLEKQFPCASWLPAIYQHNPHQIPLTWKSPQPFLGFLSLLKTNKGKLIAAALLLMGLIGWQWGLPKFAVAVNNRGVENYDAGNLQKAQSYLNLAVWLNPKNRATHYTFGNICEQVRDFECATKRYQEAAKLGLAAAYSQLGRLLIKEEQNYDDAVPLLMEGLRLPKSTPDEYALRKNLGWARLGQGRYQEAAEELKTAISLDNYRASAYCLLAQVQEEQGKMTEALTNWASCLKYAQPDEGDDDLWIDTARQRLKLR